MRAGSWNFVFQCVEYCITLLNEAVCDPKCMKRDLETRVLSDGDLQRQHGCISRWLIHIYIYTSQKLVEDFDIKGH